jgi:cytochrome oxidase Cu insertion factor (SCO1/SenC/PrrC family)
LEGRVKELDFEVDPPNDEPRVLRWHGSGCRPASDPEKQMWDLIAQLRAQNAALAKELDVLRRERPDDGMLEFKIASRVDAHACTCRGFHQPSDCPTHGRHRA